MGNIHLSRSDRLTNHALKSGLPAMRTKTAAFLPGSKDTSLVVQIGDHDARWVMFVYFLGAYFDE